MPSKKMNNNDVPVKDLGHTISTFTNKALSKYLVNPEDNNITIKISYNQDMCMKNIIYVTVLVTNENIFDKKYVELVNKYVKASNKILKIINDRVTILADIHKIAEQDIIVLLT